MVIGKKNRFAIEIEVTDFVDEWIFGKFVFWMENESIGDINDYSVDIKGCINWLKDFISIPRDRFEQGLYEKDINAAFLLLNHSVIPGEQEYVFVKEGYNQTFSRFHISHLGMSSFENVSIVLIENEKGNLRCIWQQKQEEVKECFLKKGEMKRIFIKTINYIEEKFINHS